jgi:hypothetical protein
MAERRDGYRGRLVVEQPERRRRVPLCYIRDATSPKGGWLKPLVYTLTCKRAVPKTTPTTSSPTSKRQR